MTRKYACACLALALALILAPLSAAWIGAGAEGIEEPQASVEATSLPTSEPTETATETAEPTTEPTAEPTEEPTEEPTQEPTGEPTTEPTAEPTEEPTPTPEPTATVYPTLQLGSTGDDVINLQNRLIALLYLDGTIEGMPNGTFDENTKTAVKLFQHQNALEETGIADDRLQQLLYNESTPPYSNEGGPDGPGGGDMPSGGSGRTGASSGADAQVEVETGIVPGEALTSSHASGDKDMTRYWAINATTNDENEQTLTLGEETLDISLADGTFTSTIEGDVLTLSAKAGATWTINGYALKILSISGINSLTLVSDGETITIPTEDSLSGTAYASLRARGLVSKDFTIKLTLSGGVAATVDAAGDAYPVDGSAMILNLQSVE